jgi:cyclase
MTRKRTGLLILFATMLSMAFWVLPGEAQPGTVQQIVPGVWFRQGEQEQFGHCNNVIIEMEDYLIVVDANFPSGAKAVLQDLKRISTKPVRYVFDTHHHGDHAYGNPIWTQRGATTLAYVGVAEEMKRYEPAGWLTAAKTRQDVAELNLPTAEPPMQTFRDVPFVLDDGRRRVEFHFFGWAHTRGDGFVYLPNEKVLCTGDAATNGPHNFMGHANIGNWPSVMAKARTLDVAHVLPGHGPFGGPEVLSGQQKFLEEIHAAVKTAIGQGKKLEDLVMIENGQPQATSVQLSANVQHWVGGSFPAQVQFTYEEISQGKPYGEIAGGK